MFFSFSFLHSSDKSFELSKCHKISKKEIDREKAQVLKTNHSILVFFSFLQSNETTLKNVFYLHQKRLSIIYKFGLLSTIYSLKSGKQN